MKQVEKWETKHSYPEDQPVIIRQAQYGNGETALQVFSNIGEPLCTPTVNLEEYGYHPAPGNVFVKTYSENEGVLEALQKAGIVGEVVKRYDVGFVANGGAEVPLLVEVGP